MTLQEMLLAPERQPAVVNDCLTLVQQEVGDKTVNSFAADHVRFTIETKVPRMITQLEPLWADFNASGGSDFGDYLTKRSDEATNALLSVTDASAESPTAKPTIVKAYKAVRGHAAKHVSAALPRVGALVQKYA